jgi:uncharacterized protein YndB with AHSA1/START domain
MASEKAITKSVTINAPAAKVWEALTNLDSIKAWLTENGATTVLSDWKIGSPILFTGIWHKAKYADKGTILEFEPEKVLAYSYWSRFSKLPDSPENYSVMEFRLTPEDNQTILTLIHSNLVAEGMSGHSNFYWTITLNRIKELIEKP